MILVRVFAIFVVVTTLFLAVVPPNNVLADQDDPDSLPILVQANAYRNILETGDQLYIFYANIPYSVLPDALVTEAFLWTLLDTDNVTVLGSTTGTAFNDGGYGYNVYSMYFAAATAPTWDQTYTIRLAGNPAIFDDPPTVDFILDTGDFSGLTETTAVKDEIALRVIVIARDLFIRWALDITTTLINEQETGTVLSANGETFFRGAIFGLQAMAPRAFQIAIGLITTEDREWDTEYADNITGQYAGTFVGTAQTAGADFFDKNYDLLSIIFTLGILVALVVGNLLITNNVWSGMVDVTLVAVLLARIGIPAVLLTFLGLVGAISWVYISAKLWGVLR